MTRSILIVGGGVSALAAAWAARKAGKNVTVVHRGAGASMLAGGAVDDVPWEVRWRQHHDATRTPLAHELRSAPLAKHEPRPEPLPAEVTQFVAEVGLWLLPSERLPRLATTAGRVRWARGHDRALLDLRTVAGGRVILPRVDRAGWDADALALALREEPLAKELELRFEVMDMTILRHDEERRIVDCDLAARHDQPARARWLAERLRESLVRSRGAAAVLLGPWLGAAASAAESVSSATGVAVGEALVGVGSPAGLRFAAARDRVLGSLGVEVVRARARAVTRHDARMRVRLEQSSLSADAVILAVGGLAGGGIGYTPPEHAAGEDIAPSARVPFALSVDAPVSLAAWGRPIEVVSSMHGPELDLSAWPDQDTPGLLEAVGVRSAGARVADGIFVAGDAIADRPRTMLEAIASGLRAGREA